jgi:hypothetical protein
MSYTPEGHPDKWYIYRATPPEEDPRYYPLGLVGYRPREILNEAVALLGGVPEPAIVVWVRNSTSHPDDPADPHTNDSDKYEILFTTDELTDWDKQRKLRQ